MSIRTHLLRSLLIGLTLIASLSGWLLYWHVQREMTELYNAHLRQIAIFLSNHTNSFLASTQKESLKKTLWEEEDYLVQVWSKDGYLLTESSPANLSFSINLFKSNGMHRLQHDGDLWRIYRVGKGSVIIQVAQPESARRNTITETSIRLWLPLILQIPLLMLVAWFSVKSGLKPLHRLSQVIASRQPTTLMPIDNANQVSELAPLVDTLNALLMRLDNALRQQRDFVADAAHELRTPVAAIQLQLDLLRRAQSLQEREQTILTLESGVRRMTNLIQQLLAIAQAESGTHFCDQDECDVSSLVQACLERYLPLARAKKIDLGVIEFQACKIRCHQTDVEIVIDNLVSNAVRFSPENARVDLAVYSDSEFAVIEVNDTGPGIKEGDRERIFDRFYRAPQHNGQIEGNGLGLAIVKSLCMRYHATLDVKTGNDGLGSKFILRWPLGSVVL